MRGAPADLATPRSGNSASHERRTYGCTLRISHTSVALNSARFGISTSVKVSGMNLRGTGKYSASHILLRPDGFRAPPDLTRRLTWIRMGVPTNPKCSRSLFTRNRSYEKWNDVTTFVKKT